MCMVSLYLLAILCCHTIDWDIFLRYWCLSQIYYYYYYYYDEPIAVPNTLLAYTRYGMSTATPDNLLASHFTLDEIIKAKNVLWCDNDNDNDNENFLFNIIISYRN